MIEVFLLEMLLQDRQEVQLMSRPTKSPRARVLAEADVMALEASKAAMAVPHTTIVYPRLLISPSLKPMQLLDQQNNVLTTELVRLLHREQTLFQLAKIVEPQ
jgi:hypothetical protein